MSEIDLFIPDFLYKSQEAYDIIWSLTKRPAINVYNDLKPYIEEKFISLFEVSHLVGQLAYIKFHSIQNTISFYRMILKSNPDFKFDSPHFPKYFLELVHSPDFCSSNVSDEAIYQKLLEKLSKDVFADALIFDKVDTFISIMEYSNMAALSISLYQFDPNFEFSKVIDICGYFGSKNCFKYLVSKKDIHELATENTFKCACIGGNMEIVRFCIQNNINQGQLSYAWAIRAHNDEITDWLAESNVYIDLYYPIISGNLKRLFPLLTQKSIDEETIKLSCGMSAACQISNIKLAKFFLDHAHQPYKHISPLYESVVSGNIEMVKEMFKYDNNVNKVSFTNNTPLSLALNHGYIDIAKFLVDNGASIDKALENNFSTHTLVSHFDLLKFFIENGLDVNKQFNYLQGETLLFAAIQNSRLDSVKYLIEKGANLHYKANHNRSAIHYAVLGGDLEMVQFILDNGFDIDEKDGEGETPLQLLAEFIINIPKEYQDGKSATKVRNALKLGANPNIIVSTGPVTINEDWIAEFA